ncbi:MAG: oligosaccharide flippase family protein [bacterium]|nr:oligosaccharide flippase family protein [bacterium]
MLSRFGLGWVTTTSLRLNMVGSALFWMVNSLTSLILIRMILSYVSLGDYGYWAAFWALTSYFTLSDLGLGPTITRYIADTKIDKERKRGLVGVILGIEFISAVVLSGILMVFYLYFYQHKLMMLFVLILTAQFFTQLGMNFLAIINGLQKIFLANLILIFKTLVYFFITLMLIKKWHLIGMAVSFAISGSLLFLISGFLVWWYFKPSWRSLAKVERDLGSRVFKFSRSMFILKIVGQTRNQFDRIILSIVSSPELTAIVDLAKKLINPVRGVYISLISPVFPVFSQLHSQGDEVGLKKVLKKTILLAVAVLFLLFGVLVAAVPWVVKLWLGKSFLKILPAVYILVVSEMINLLMYPVNLKIIASDKHEVLVKFVTAVTIVQLTASLTALYYWNYLVMLSVFAGVEFAKFIIWLFLFKDQFLIKTDKNSL